MSNELKKAAKAEKKAAAAKAEKKLSPYAHRCRQPAVPLSGCPLYQKNR